MVSYRQRRRNVFRRSYDGVRRGGRSLIGRYQAYRSDRILQAPPRRRRRRPTTKKILGVSLPIALAIAAAIGYGYYKKKETGLWFGKF
jgi:hypothetical protein